MEIKCKFTESLYPSFRRQTAGSAGFDLRAAKTVTIMPGKTEVIPTGVWFHIADNEWCAMVLPRSGLATTHSLAPINSPGLIDSDYQGQIKVAMHNFGKDKQIIGKGDRIAQIVPMHIGRFRFDFVDSFNEETERGEGGFGSTGSE